MVEARIEPHPLQLWREATGTTQTDLMRRLGHKQVGTLKGWELMGKMPRFDQRLRVEEVTGGAVTGDMMVDWSQRYQKARHEMLKELGECAP